MLNFLDICSECSLDIIFDVCDKNAPSGEQFRTVMILLFKCADEMQNFEDYLYHCQPGALCTLKAEIDE